MTRTAPSPTTPLPEPQVGVSDHYAFDTAGTEGNNGDGIIDAGETIALGLTLRNRWGKGDDLTVTLNTLSMAGIPDPYITLHNPTVDYDSIGTYSTQDAGRIYTGDLFTGWEKPFYITVAPDCPNDYIFTLNVTMSCTNGMDPEDTTEYVTQGTVTLRVRSGKVLPSVISEDLTLTRDNLYIIPSGTVITITQAQDTSSLGDVDGNGTISPLDALLLLQHINDLVNIRWRARSGADRHYSFEMQLIDPVGADLRPVAVGCPPQTGCFYHRKVTAPGGEQLHCVYCGDLVPVAPLPPWATTTAMP